MVISDISGDIQQTDPAILLDESVTVLEMCHLIEHNRDHFVAEPVYIAPFSIEFHHRQAITKRSDVMILVRNHQLTVLIDESPFSILLHSLESFAVRPIILLAVFGRLIPDHQAAIRLPWTPSGRIRNHDRQNYQSQ